MPIPHLRLLIIAARPDRPKLWIRPGRSAIPTTTTRSFGAPYAPSGSYTWIARLGHKMRARTLHTSSYFAVCFAPTLRGSDRHLDHSTGPSIRPQTPLWLFCHQPFIWEIFIYFLHESFASYVPMSLVGGFGNCLVRKWGPRPPPPVLS
jgi:hypothetical protein